jgi:hypothetical protein
MTQLPVTLALLASFPLMQNRRRYVAISVANEFELRVDSLQEEFGLGLSEDWELLLTCALRE